ncbi:MAG: MBL fold metallo-hydrolase [Deltaproteobacteria bacterium]|nr:MBL fold metallo-hydrolase [Deltaproteobacteria bacterium]
MQIRFLGHAAFAVELAGARLCLDPHKPGALGGRFQLPEIQGPFDAIVHSHRHEDHAAWTPALGTTRVAEPPCCVGSVQLDARAAFHDAQQGLQMGMVRMLELRGEGLRIVHSGDLGAWTASDVEWLRGCDVLLLAAGGTYTLDPAQAAELARQVGARAVVPMHMADPRVAVRLRPVEEYLAAWAGPSRRAAALDGALWQELDQSTAIILDYP